MAEPSEPAHRTALWVVAGLLLGALAGAAAGLLRAPAPVARPADEDASR